MLISKISYLRRNYKYFNQNKQRYDIRTIYVELLHRGFSIGHNKVQKLMYKMRLEALKSKVIYHSYIYDVGKKAPNFIERNFIATKPNKKWKTDITQFNFPFKKIY